MSISINGIEQAIAGIGYRNTSAVKYRVLNAILQYYKGVNIPETIHSISPDEIVRSVWGEGLNVAEIQSKRKNLSSIRSSINSDLDRAWQEGLNPEGIMISAENAFTMSNQAKDKMLATISGAVSSDGSMRMGDINAALQLVSEFLSSRKESEIAGELDKLREIVKKVTEKIVDFDVSDIEIVKKGELSPGGARKVASTKDGSSGMGEGTGLETAAKMEGAAGDLTLDKAESLRGQIEAEGAKIADSVYSDFPPGKFHPAESLNGLLETGVAGTGEDGLESEEIKFPGEETLQVMDTTPQEPEAELEVAEEDALEVLEDVEEVEAVEGTDVSGEIEAAEDIEVVEEDNVEVLEEAELPEAEGEIVQTDEEVELAPEEDDLELVEEPLELVEEGPQEPEAELEVAEEDALEVLEDVGEVEAVEDTDVSGEIEAAEDMEVVEEDNVEVLEEAELPEAEGEIVQTDEEVELAPEEDDLEIVEEPLELVEEAPLEPEPELEVAEEDALEVLEDVEEVEAVEDTETSDEIEAGEDLEVMEEEDLDVVEDEEPLTVEGEMVETNEALEPVPREEEMEVLEEPLELVEEIPATQDQDLEISDDVVLELVEALDDPLTKSADATKTVSSESAGHPVSKGKRNAAGEKGSGAGDGGVKGDLGAMQGEGETDLTDGEDFEILSEEDDIEIVDEDSEIVEGVPVELDEDMEFVEDDVVDFVDEIEDLVEGEQTLSKVSPEDAEGVKERETDSIKSEDSIMGWGHPDTEGGGHGKTGRGPDLESSGPGFSVDGKSSEEVGQSHGSQGLNGEDDSFGFPGDGGMGVGEGEMIPEEDLDEVIEMEEDLIEEMSTESVDDSEILDEEDVDLLEEAELNENIEAVYDDSANQQDTERQGDVKEDSAQKETPDINGVDEIVKTLLSRDTGVEKVGKPPQKRERDWLNNVGLPVEMLEEEGIDFENLEADIENKKVLASRFDGYLGVMERYFNQLITIPAGEYVVGGKGDQSDELPTQKVALNEYYLGKFPVTNATFEIFIDRTGYVTTAEKLGFGYVFFGRFQKIVDEKTGRTRSIWNPTYTRKKISGASWFQPTGPGSSLHNKRNHPVVQVSLKDAMSFAAWTGRRLPTEREWEAAARTIDGRLYPWGDEWFDNHCNVESAGISDTTPVNLYLNGDNPLGVSDLLGNIMEWTKDRCEPKFEVKSSAVFYIAKGGGWIADSHVTLASRFRIPADFSSNLLGFRCAVD